jgi:hypothetical protein
MVHYHTKTPIGFGVTLLESDDTPTREAGLRHITMHLTQGTPSKSDLDEAGKALIDYAYKTSSAALAKEEKLVFVSAATSLVKNKETDIEQTRDLTAHLTRAMIHTEPNHNNIPTMLAAYSETHNLYVRNEFGGKYSLYSALYHAKQMAEGEEVSPEKIIAAHTLLADDNDAVREYAFNNLSKYYQDRANMPSYKVEKALFNCVGGDEASKVKAVQIQSAIAMMTETDSCSLTMPATTFKNNGRTHGVAILMDDNAELLHVSLNGNDGHGFEDSKFFMLLCGGWINDQKERVHTYKQAVNASAPVIS